MADIHIEDFYKDAARIMVQLYNAFPRKTTLYVEDIAGPDTPDDFGLHSPRHLACLSCIYWLADEGYLRFEDSIRQEAVDQAVLSQKSFTLLTKIADVFGAPSSTTGYDLPRDDLPRVVAEDLQTYVSHIRKTLAHGSSTAIAKLMADFLSR